MKTLIQSCLILVATGLGLALGLTWKGHQVRTVMETHATSNVNKSTNTTKIRPVRRDDSTLATELQNELSKSSGVTKWLCWMAALEKAQPSDFPRLARLSHGNNAVWRAVVNRWIDIAPGNLFETLASVSKFGGDLPVIELGRELFDQWPKRDPQAAIAAVSQSRDLGMRDSWRLQVATAVIDNNVEEGLTLMSKWHIENYGPRMDAVKAWAAPNPQHAAEFVIANPAGFASQLAMDTVGEVWAKSDPAGALAFASGQPGDLGLHLAGTVLKQWAGQDLQAATDWLAAASEHTRNQLSPAFVETWAKQDTAAAMAWCEANLQGLPLTLAVGGVVKGVSEKDPSVAATLVTTMQPGPARTEAAGIVAQKLFPDFSSAEPVKAETLAWLSNLDPESVKRVLSQISWSWADTDPQSMAKFLGSATNQEVPSYADSILARQWVRSSPVEALDWAESLPQTRGLSAGRDAFTQWHQFQSEAAMTWLDALSATDPRRQPFFESMIRSIATGPQATQQLAAMSATEQAAAQTVIANMTLSDDQRATLLAALHP